MPVAGVIFDLGSTLIHRTGLELEQEKCRALAWFAASAWGCRDPEGLAAQLLEIRLDGWRRSQADLTEVPATDSIERAFTIAGLPAGRDTIARAETVFFEPEVRASRLYPGAVELLDALRAKGLHLGLISNATSHGLILDITAKLRIDAYFDPLVTSCGHGRVKPHPDIFAHVLQGWQVPAEAAVMVGDTMAADIAGANAVGMRSILVDIEPNPSNAAFNGPASPTARVEALAEIAPLIEGWIETD
jgi:HAD superfamily hydrolase (TIGR01509 family)